MIFSEPPTSVIVDNMILVMFVDSGMAALLPALAKGRILIPPSILEVEEINYNLSPTSEFIKGLFRFRNMEDDSSKTRLNHRQNFVRRPDSLWTAVTPTLEELRLAHTLTKRETREKARQLNPSFKTVRVDPGEAEAASIAITRGYHLWTDDIGIISIVHTLYPEVTIERTCALVARAINEKLISWSDGYILFETVFKEDLNLHTIATLVWEKERAQCVVSR